MRCPGCGTIPTPGTVPGATLDQYEHRLSDKDRVWWNPTAWWCPSCLAARLLATHDDHCRCAGCQPEGRTAA